MRTEQMLSTHPTKPQMPISDLSACIAAASECATICNTCADACLAEEQVQMLVKCIRLNLDCVDVCEVTARMLSRQTETVPALVRAQLEACIQACRACAAECERHAGRHEHCRVCAEACRECERSCMSMLERIPAGVQH